MASVRKSSRKTKRLKRGSSGSKSSECVVTRPDGSQYVQTSVARVRLSDSFKKMVANLSDNNCSVCGYAVEYLSAKYRQIKPGRDADCYAVLCGRCHGRSRKLG